MKLFKTCDECKKEIVRNNSYVYLDKNGNHVVLCKHCDSLRRLKERNAKLV